MTSRVLETILRGRNELSPVLAEASRDVTGYATAVETAHGQAGESAEKSARRQQKAADDVAQANSRVKLSAQDAAQQVGEVRGALVDLGTKKLGVDVDTVDARMQLAELRARLDEVAASEPTARVQAETAAATAELRAVQAELNRIDGQRATAKVDVESSAARSELNALTSAAWAVSPALIPIGAAAVAGLGAIPGLAAAGVGGLGVLIGTLAGVSSAVKLLGQQEDAAAAASTAAAGSGVSSAAAIASAEASLANVRANAADAAIRSAEQVDRARRDEVTAERDAAQSIQTALDRQQQAERGLAGAQRDELHAQTDLTAARKTASQQLEDLTNQVADNALAQRQSVLDVRDAKRALDNVLANPAATAAQREQAQIAYDRQVQQQKELALSGRRLADQKADADRKGVDGADRVVAAQQKVADAQLKVTDAAKNAGQAATAVDQARVDAARKVADAQLKVTDAVREQAAQQRQAAFSISQAQAAVENAMRSSGAAGATALDGIQRKLDQLDPATREFATYLRGTWKPIWAKVTAAASGGLLPGAREGLEAVRPVMPQITGLVGDLAGTLGHLAAEGGHALSGPFWTDFLAMARRDAGPLLTDLVHGTGNLAHGFAGVAMAFSPMSREVGGGLVDLTGKFAHWGEELHNSRGFHDFIDYARENWPQVEQTIGNVATIVGHLIEAGAPIGGAYLTGFRLLSDVLAGLPIGVVQALLVTFLAFKSVQSVVGTIDGVAGAVTRLADTTTGLPTKLGATTSSLGKLGTAAQGVLGVLGGPWGLALAGASLVVGQISADMSEASANTDQWARALLEGGKAAASVQDKYLGQYGGKGPDFLGKTAEWLGLTASMDGVRSKADEVRAAMSPLERAHADVTRATNNLSKAQQDYGQNSPQAARAADEVRAAQGRLDAETRRTNDATLTQIELMQRKATAALGAVDADLAAQQAQDQLADAIDQYNRDVAEGGRSTRQLTEESRSLAQQAKQTAQAAAEAAVKQAGQNGITDNGTIANAAMLKSLQDTAQHLTGPGRDAVLQMIQALDQGKGQAVITAGAISELGVKVLGLPDGHHIEIDAPTSMQMQALEMLNVKTRTLDNGHVIVDADTVPAMRAMRALVDAYKDYQININPQGFAITTEQRNRLYGAVGGIVHAYADGGIEPMRGDIAQVVSPNRLRVIGDRVVNDEFFIPDNSDPRSLAIGAEYVRRHPEAALAALGGRPSSNAAGTGFTTAAAAMPGYTAAGTAGIDYGRLAAAIAQAMPAGGSGGPLFHADKVELTRGTPHDVAQELAYIGRTRGW